MEKVLFKEEQRFNQLWLWSKIEAEKWPESVVRNSKSQSIIYAMEKMMNGERLIKDD